MNRKWFENKRLLEHQHFSIYIYNGIKRGMKTHQVLTGIKERKYFDHFPVKAKGKGTMLFRNTFIDCLVNNEYILLFVLIL